MPILPSEVPLFGECPSVLDESADPTVAIDRIQFDAEFNQIGDGIVLHSIPLGRVIFAKGRWRLNVQQISPDGYNVGLYQHPRFVIWHNWVLQLDVTVSGFFPEREFGLNEGAWFTPDDNPTTFHRRALVPLPGEDPIVIPAAEGLVTLNPNGAHVDCWETHGFFNVGHGPVFDPCNCGAIVVPSGSTLYEYKIVLADVLDISLAEQADIPENVSIRVVAERIGDLEP